jgi:hypothetical protein
MKKLFFVALAISGFMAGLVWSQVEQRPYIYKFDKGFGDCTFTGVSKDALWSATIKTLMLNKYEMLSFDKPSDTISASHLPPFGVSYRITLILEDREGGVGMYASVEYRTNWGVNHEKEKTEKKLYDQIAATVYDIPAYAKPIKK